LAIVSETEAFDIGDRGLRQFSDDTGKRVDVMIVFATVVPPNTP